MANVSTAVLAAQPPREAKTGSGVSAPAGGRLTVAAAVRATPAYPPLLQGGRVLTLREGGRIVAVLP